MIVQAEFTSFDLIYVWIFKLVYLFRVARFWLWKGRTLSGDEKDEFQAATPCAPSIVEKRLASAIDLTFDSNFTLKRVFSFLKA